MSQLTFTSEIKVNSVQQCGGDILIIGAMWQSTNPEEALAKAKSLGEKAIRGRIKYLIENKHTSPLEHGLLTLNVHAPAFVWWQWVRHRFHSLDCEGFSFNLESGRYRELEPVFWIPPRNRPITPTKSHKAARPDFQPMEADYLYENVIGSMKYAYENAWKSYQLLIWDRDGKEEYQGNFPIATEVARSVLPFGIYYHGWVSTDPLSLMNFLAKRTRHPNAKIHSYVQAEIEEAAEITEAIFKEFWPITWEVWNENGRQSL